MKTALPVLFLLLSFSVSAQVKKDDVEVEKLISNLHLVENLKERWLKTINKSFDEHPEEWEQFTEPLKAKLALMDSIYTAPEQSLSKVFYGKIKSDFTTKEIVEMNVFFSTEAGQKYLAQLGIFKFDPYDMLIVQEESNYHKRIMHDFFAKNQQYRKQIKQN